MTLPVDTYPAILILITSNYIIRVSDNFQPFSAAADSRCDYGDENSADAGCFMGLFYSLVLKSFISVTYVTFDLHINTFSYISIIQPIWTYLSLVIN